MTRALDHLVLCVADLERARASYRALGFTTTPIAKHPFGTWNSLVQMAGRNFLELLALDPAQPIPPEEPGHFSFAARTRDFLRERGEGMSMLVFASRDARADDAAFRAAELDTYEPLDFGRDARLPDGSVARVAFSLAFVTNPAMPNLAFFTCQQRHAPELFWKPEFQRHANGAQRIVEVVMSAPDPAAHAGFFERLTGGPIAATEGALCVGPEGDRITVLDPARLRARFPAWEGTGAVPAFVGYRLAVAEPARIPHVLDEAGTAYRDEAVWIVVSAHGVAIEFERSRSGDGRCARR
jgi:hypothetical protein